MKHNITHNLETRRFWTEVENQKAYLTYLVSGNEMDIISTYVPRNLEGRGIASELSFAAFEYAREKNLKVIPSCSYIKIWLERHPEYKQ